MTKDGKNLKIMCISCLFIGLAVIAIGIIEGETSTFDADALATLGCGLVAVPSGAQSSRLANVPSNVHKVRLLGLVVLVAAIALGCVSYFMGKASVIQYVGLALLAVVGLAMLFFAQRITKELERV